MNIHRALSDIAEIRAQLDRTETWRGFRSAAVGISVLVLMIGVWVEKTWIVDPVIQVGPYLTVWICVAAISGAVALIEMVIRGQKSGNQIVWKMHRSLGQQIAPSLLVGFVLTLLIASHSVEQQAIASDGTDGVVSRGAGMMWALPGVWALIYGIGLFSCLRNLPRFTIWVAIYFLCSGLLVLANSWVSRELAGWQMLVTFGVGQFLLASVLFWNLEGRDDET